MTSQYLARLAVDYQFAEAERPPVDNRAGGRVESNGGGHNIVRLTGFDLAEPNLGVLWVCEAANRTDAILKRDGRTSNRVSRGDEAVVDGLRDEHQPSGDIPRREDIGRSCLKVFVNLHVLTLIQLDAGRIKI